MKQACPGAGKNWLGNEPDLGVGEDVAVVVGREDRQGPLRLDDLEPNATGDARGGGIERVFARARFGREVLRGRAAAWILMSRWLAKLLRAARGGEG